MGIFENTILGIDKNIQPMRNMTKTFKCFNEIRFGIFRIELNIFVYIVGPNVFYRTLTSYENSRYQYPTSGTTQQMITIGYSNQIDLLSSFF